MRDCNGRVVWPGSKVRHIHPHDGTERAGKPTGEILKVISIEDHKPIDGPVERSVIAKLSDGSWSFTWNLFNVVK